MGREHFTEEEIKGRVQELADQGHAFAHHELAHSYEFGSGFARSSEKVLHHLHAAAELGDAGAVMFHVARSLCRTLLMTPSAFREQRAFNYL